MHSAVLFLLLCGQVAWSADQILLMRHCPRAPGPLKEGRFPEEFASLNDYSQFQFPATEAWGAAPNQCTPAGLAAAESYSSLLGELLGQVNLITADDVTRTIDTANRLARKLAPGRSIKINGGLFSPADKGICRKLSQAEKSKCLEDQLASVPWPLGSEGLQRQLQELQNMIGRGRAPALDTISSNVSDGKFIGGAYLASEIIENFNLEFASGLDMAWGRITESDLYGKFLGLHGYYFQVAHGGIAIAQREASGILATVTDLLNLGGGGSEIFVAHDTTLAGVVGLLGLQANCAPSLLHGAPPLSGLLFKLDGLKDVRIEFLSPLHKGASDIYRCPVAVNSTQPVGVPLSSFKTLVNEAIDPNCVEEVSIVV